MNMLHQRRGILRVTALVIAAFAVISGCSKSADITESDAIWSSFAQERASETRIPSNPAMLVSRATVIFRGYVTKIKPADKKAGPEAALFQVNVTEVIKGDVKPGNFDVLVWSPNKIHDGTPAGQTGDALWFLESSGTDFFIPASSRGIWAANKNGPVRTVLADSGSQALIPADVKNLDQAVTLVKGLVAQ